MAYFNSSFLNFFSGLAANNSTEWFNDNRKTYEKEVKKPFQELVSDMIGLIKKHEPEIEIKPADAIMRINKDIRFSKDKTPYNTHVAANISVYGKKDKSYPGFYFQLSHTGGAVFGGAYMVESPVLQTLRQYISENTQDFAAAYSNQNFMQTFGEIQGEQSKRIPPELKEATEAEPLLANKQFYYSANFAPEIITALNLPDTLMDYYLAGKPVNDFLKKALAGK